MASDEDTGWGPHNCKDCRKCGRKPVFTEVTVRSGEKVERQMCEECARDEGISSQSHAPINQLLTKFVMSQSSASSKPATKTAECESCGTAFAEFRKTGLLGCAECYASFESQLGPLIERAHEGGTHHIGKIPQRAGVSYDRQQRISALRKQLSEAIAGEQYERAAALRDQIRAFESESGGGPPDRGERGASPEPERRGGA